MPEGNKHRVRYDITKSLGYYGPNTRIIIAGVIFEFLGISFIVFITLWVCIYLRGATLFGDKQQLANLHAVLMPTSLIFLEGNGIIIYRIFKGYNSRGVRFFHYGFQTMALLFTIIGYIAIFYAREEHVKKFYSLHSWLGLVVIFVFLTEFFGGIYTFHAKFIPIMYREVGAAFHSFFGLFNCILAIWVSCLGLTTLSTQVILLYDEFTTPTLLGNLAGLAMIFYGAMVFFICTHPDFEWEDEHKEQTG